MTARLRDFAGAAISHAAAWMGAQAHLAAEKRGGLLADLKRANISNDLLTAGALLHVSLSRLAAELGKPAVLSKWPGPGGLPAAVADVAGSGILALGGMIRWAPLLLSQAAGKPVGPGSDLWPTDAADVDAGAESASGVSNVTPLRTLPLRDPGRPDRPDGGRGAA